MYGHSVVDCAFFLFCLTASITDFAFGGKDVAAQLAQQLPPAATSSAMKTMLQSVSMKDGPFQASQHLQEVIAFVTGFADEQRTLTVLDFYAGDANLARRARRRNHVAQTFDILHSPTENVFTREGFFIGLGLCCSVEMLL